MEVALFRKGDTEKQTARRPERWKFVDSCDNYFPNVPGEEKTGSNV